MPGVSLGISISLGLSPKCRSVALGSVDNGYLWRLRSFEANGKSYTSCNMFGNGGNKVSVLPSLDMVVTLTATNFNQRDAHQLTEKPLTDYILPSVGT